MFVFDWASNNGEIVHINFRHANFYVMLTWYID
jgi:hypothetical protein